MTPESTTITTMLPAVTATPSLARLRVLEGSGTLLVGRLRLHARRVRALVVNFRHEVERLSPGAEPELQRIDAGLAVIAERITTALTAIETAFAANVAAMVVMEQLAVAIDLGQPDHAPAERIAAQAGSLLHDLHAHHAVTHVALKDAVEQLVTSANNLAIAVGRPGAQSMSGLRVIIRQMRALSAVTAELGARLDVFVQNQSVVLQELSPMSVAKGTLLRGQDATASRTGEGVGV